MTTPSMLLTLPTVSVTLGPAWASQLNVALEAIDLHDHTANKGVKVPSAGLNINADLSFANNALLAVKHVGIATGSVDPAIAGAVYVKNGDLYYTATNLTPVQLTNGTSIQGVAGNISGLGDGGSTAAFNDFTEDFTFKFNSGDKHAALNIGEIRLFPFDGVNPYSFPVTLKAPLTLASAYSLTLPDTAPASDLVLSVTAAGVIKYGLGNGTVAVPAIAFESDPDSGMYRIAANNIGVAVNAAKVLDISTAGLSVTGVFSATGVVTAPAGVAGNTTATASASHIGSEIVSYLRRSNVAGTSGAIHQQYVTEAGSSLYRFDTEANVVANCGTLSLTSGIWEIAYHIPYVQGLANTSEHTTAIFNLTTGLPEVASIVYVNTPGGGSGTFKSVLHAKTRVAVASTTSYSLYAGRNGTDIVPHIHAIDGPPSTVTDTTGGASYIRAVRIG